MKMLAAIVLLVGCASPGPGGPTGPSTSPPPKTDPTPPPPTDPTPPPKTDPTPTPTQTDPGIGEKCAPDGRCAAPATCVTYYGIAGPRGPAFRSCEVKCTKGDAKGCPDGKSCTTIADGPGSVCR